MSNVVDEQIVETNDELEILLDRLNRLQKSIAGVDAAFNVDSLIKYSEKIMGTASTVNILSGALGGNKVALAEMQKEMPMTYQSLQTLEKSFRNFRFGIENGNYMTGLTEGFKVLQNNMNRVQKGLVGVSAGFTELSSVKNSVSDVITETDSLAGNIAEMSVSVIGAGAAFSSVFGFPAGVVASGIMGVIGAIAGIGEAFEEIEAEKFGESVKNALSNPGGVPIEELTNSVVNSIVSIGDKFSVITEKSQELDMAEKNVQDIWLEIETIQTKMDAGVMSVAEGSAELTRLFGELATAAQTKFGTLEQTLVAMLGENGYIRQYAETLGVDVTEGLLVCLGVADDMKERATELINLLANPNVSDSERLRYYEELLNILGVTDEVTTAMNNFNSELANISTDNVEVAMNSVVSAVQNADKALTDAEAGMIRTLEEMKVNAESLEEQQYIQFLIDLVPGAIAQSKEQVRQEAALFTEQLKTDLFGGIEGTIDEETKNWNSMNPLQRIWYSIVEGIDTKDEYLQKCLEDYNANEIGTISETIDEKMKELEIEGVKSASETMENIIGALFDVTQYSDGNGVFSNTELNKKWREILNGVTDGTYDIMKENGVNTVTGFFEGISESASLASETISYWMDEDVIGTVRERLDLHSPSKLMEEFGMYSVLGYNKGIEDYTPLTTMTLTAYVNSALSALGGMYGKMYLSGANSMLGIYDGLQSKEALLYTKAQLIADNIKRIFNGETVVNTEIVVPSMSYADFAPYRSVYEPMDFSGSITSQVEVAVSNAMIPYLEQIANNTKEALNKELSVNIGDREIARANARGQSAMGIQLIK